MRIMKNLLAVSAMAMALGAASAHAQTVQTNNPPPPPPPENCGGGVICGIPVTTYVVSSEVAGITFGQGVGQSATSGTAGNTGDTGSWANGVSQQSLRTNIWGSANGCTTNCGDVGGAFEASASDEREAGSFAFDAGPTSSSASAASGVQGASSLLGRIQVGRQQAPANPH